MRMRESDEGGSKCQGVAQSCLLTTPTSSGSRQDGWRIDSRRLHAYLERDGEIWQAHFFASVTDPPRYEQTAYCRFIKNEMRYEVALYRLGQKTVRCRDCGTSKMVPVEKGVDVGLATKLLVLANARAFDTAILVAADKDYLETVRAVKGNGLHVEIVAWRGRFHARWKLSPPAQ